MGNKDIKREVKKPKAKSKKTESLLSVVKKDESSDSSKR